MKRVALAIVMACGGGGGMTPMPDAPPGPLDVIEKSGTRLVVDWWQTDDGTRIRRGVFDSQLGATPGARRRSRTRPVA